MSTFLAIYFSVYTTMHLVVFLRLRSLFAGHRGIQAVVAIFFLVMIIGPVCTRLLEHGGQELAARAFAWVAYPWLGFMLLCFTGCVGLTVAHIVLKLINMATGARLPLFDGPLPTIAILALALASCGYGYLEAKHIRTERLVIKTGKLPAGTDRVRIAQISDVHLGLITRGERLAAILDIVREEKPDLLVSTGDLVDGSMGHIDELVSLFDRIDPPWGKYAVTGNHEFYAGLDRSIELTRLFGFRLLRGEAVTVGGSLTIAGVDDPQVDPLADDSALLSSVQDGRFVLLLKHRPFPMKASLGLYDLQLSGHTHKGQIFPFNFVTGRVYPMQNGFYELEKGSRLYTSRGTGTWGPPIRLFAPPEVTIIDLIRIPGPGLSG